MKHGQVEMEIIVKIVIVVVIILVLVAAVIYLQKKNILIFDYIKELLRLT